jgi:hypothetical protein
MVAVALKKFTKTLIEYEQEKGWYLPLSWIGMT